MILNKMLRFGRKLGFLLFLFSSVNAQTPLKQKTDDFIVYMTPKIVTVNLKIGQKREQLLYLYQKFRQKEHLSVHEVQWLLNLSHEYQVTHFTITNNHHWQQLITRVDIVPVSLTLAQAANESAWGKSRFAKMANNYFGHQCFRKGCGIVPKGRERGKFEVKVFPNPEAAIAAYMRNLNTHPAYQKLRELRKKARQLHKPLSGYRLAEGLRAYSTRKQGYINSIRAIIQRYRLEKVSGNIQ